MDMWLIKCPEVIAAIKSGKFPVLKMYASSLHIVDNYFMIAINEEAFFFGDYRSNERESKRFYKEYPDAKVKFGVRKIDEDFIRDIFF